MVPTLGLPDMAAQLGDVRLQIVFSRAFLVELQRGNVEMAALFARAFLKHHAVATSLS